MKDRNRASDEGYVEQTVFGLGHIGNCDPHDDEATTTWAERYAGRLWLPDSEVRGGYREWNVARAAAKTRQRKPRPVGFHQTRGRGR